MKKWQDANHFRVKPGEYIFLEDLFSPVVVFCIEISLTCVFDVDIFLGSGGGGYIVVARVFFWDLCTVQSGKLLSQSNKNVEE